MSHYEVTLLLGSNLGDTNENINQAISLIEARIGEVSGRSDILNTAPVEFVSNNNFCNIAVRTETGLSPIFLLNSVKEIEIEMGRNRDSQMFGVYEDRIIDIDIVLFGNINFSSARLQIPHRKHLYERDFSRELLRDLDNKTLKT